MVAMVLATGGCLSDAILGPGEPSLTSRSTAERQNLVVSGAGLMVQPTRIQADVPVQDASDIVEATFFWTGRASTPGGDDTILIDGVPRIGTLVDSRDLGGDEGWLFIYRLDGVGIVFPGDHDYIVSGFDPGGTRKGGIALVVIYRDPSAPWFRVRTVEPQEIVRSDLPGHETGDVWAFPVQPTDEMRVARLTVVAADCESGLPDRIWYGAAAGAAPAGDLAGTAVGVFDNLLRSAYGPWLDVVIRPNLLLPPGAGHFAYQLESPQGGDSIVHLFGAVCITGDEPPCDASIGDLVWHDLDGDGMQDPDEPGLAGVTVSLLGADQAELQSTQTDGSGHYAFTGLCAGDYAVSVVTPDGFEASPCDAGDDALDSECSVASVTLATDTDVVSDIDFGFMEPVPALAPGCFFGPGFWKHQFDVSLGDHPGYQHFSDDELTALLQVAAGATATTMDGGDGEISFQEADDILDSRGPSSDCDRALRQYLATLLNFAVNGADPHVEVDVDGDGTPDVGFGEAIDEIEEMMSAEDESLRACSDGKAWAESINSMGSLDCRSEVESE